MIYLGSAILVYLLIGVVLTRSVSTRGPTLRISFRDVVVGAVLMPVVFLLALVCIAFEELWARLLIALDYEPPEEMRAGPEAQADDDRAD